MTREEGYYRVKYKGEWCIADYMPHLPIPWRFYDRFLKESEFDEINESPINPNPQQPAIGFSLDDMLDCWERAKDWEWSTHFGNPNTYPSKEKYFKEKFNIDISNHSQEVKSNNND